MSSARKYIDTLRHAAGEERQKFQTLLGVMGINEEIDEIAIAYPHGGELLQADLNLGLWRPQREDTDVVLARTPYGYEGYDVQYHWQPAVWGRYEVMSVLAGRSPVHQAVHDPIPFHASFKVPSLYIYASVCNGFKGANFKVVQECVSKYGVFSYWQTPFSGVYLKPRVNLRDS